MNRFSLFEKKNSSYVFIYKMLEFLSLGILCLNVYMSYALMGPELLTYGVDYAQYLLGWTQADPRVPLFSPHSKCSVPSFGMNGKRKVSKCVKEK